MVRTGKIPQIPLSILIVTLTAAACYPLSALIGYRSVALILLLVVSLLAIRMSLAAIIAAATVSALIWDYFFIPPHFTFTIGAGEDLLLLIMYIVVAVLSGVINYRLRQMEHIRKAKAEREKVLQLYNVIFSSLSHELRTPVSAILGAADTLYGHGDSLSEAQKKTLLEEITNGSLRLSEQLENLLSMSRIEAGVIRPKKEWCDVSDLIYGIAGKLERERGQHPLHIRLPEQLPLVQLDFGLTETCLRNLLHNAFRHTPGHAAVTISAEIMAAPAGRFEAQDEDITLISDHSPHVLQIVISDAGAGFPPDAVDKVFDKFYRLGDHKSDGMGLGLYIVKGLTEVQGGEVMLVNHPKNGAKFILEFPTSTLQQALHHG